MRTPALLCHIGAGALLALTLATAPARAADQDAQLWLVAAARAPVADRVDATIEFSARLSDDRDGVGTGIARGWIGYDLSHAVTLDVGYGRFVSYDDGVATQKEDRIFQGITWRMGRAAGGQWTSRTRFEQRMIAGAGTTGLRLRQRMTYARPIAAKARLNLFVEPFFALNDTDYGARTGLEVLRSSAAVSLSLSDAVDLDIGYINQWNNRRGRIDTIAHAASLSLLYKF